MRDVEPRGTNDFSEIEKIPGNLAGSLLSFLSRPKSENRTRPDFLVGYHLVADVRVRISEAENTREGNDIRELMVP